MTLKQFSYVMSATFAVLLISAAALLAHITTRMGQSSLGIENAVASIRASEELQVSLLDSSRRALLKAGEANLAEAKEKVLYWLSEVERHVDPTNNQEKILFAETSRAVERYLDSRSAAARGATLADAFEKAGVLTDLNLQQAEFYQLHLRSDDALANWLAVLIIFLGLVFIPVSWLLVRKNLYRPITALHGSISGFSGSEAQKVPELGLVEIRDITRAFNSLTERLAEQKKSQLKFLAAVAHDLRNPLSAIKMSTQILDDERFDANDALPIIQIISRQSEQLDRMVGDLLDSTRIEAGQLELKLENTSLIPIISDAVKLYSSVSKLHRIHFSTTEEHLICKCDPTRIGQTLNNLLSNSIKYSPNGGAVEVTAKRDDGYAVIQVRDEGIGIAEADLTGIFEPFRRTKLTKSSIPGVGLGLSVVKRIISAHKGEISVESEADRGTTFTIRIPLAAEDQTSRRSIEAKRRRGEMELN